ncbi:hypothetical protein ATANTOWER_010067 [Ataeniobius toweri]|uniref:Uncharacterized protein n=1 Tax=Ataeniobius toweri TaxID=208326 RepID=A0ABU7AAZ7_9TELE|nr:hypothetical protein [Ataeniobius toweri]
MKQQEGVLDKTSPLSPRVSCSFSSPSWFVFKCQRVRLTSALTRKERGMRVHGDSTDTGTPKDNAFSFTLPSSSFSTLKGIFL